KRGVLVELALARLRGRVPGVRTWGLSATLSDLDGALAALLGPAGAGAGRIVRGGLARAPRIESLIPTTLERHPWAGQLGLRLLPQVLAELESARTALVFTHTRGQTEIWFQAILASRPGWADTIRLHLGAL